MLKVNTCYGRVDSELLSRLSSIKLLAFDVDGTITDGGIYYDNKDIELKKQVLDYCLGVDNYKLNSEEVMLSDIFLHGKYILEL